MRVTLGHVSNVCGFISRVIHVKTGPTLCTVHGLFAPLNKTLILPLMHFSVPVSKADGASLIVPHGQGIDPSNGVESHDPGSDIVSPGINVLHEYIFFPRSFDIQQGLGLYGGVHITLAIGPTCDREASKGVKGCVLEAIV